MNKLKEIWSELKDSVVTADPSPRRSARLSSRRGPSCDREGLEGQAHEVPCRQPANQMIAYQVVPFAFSDDQFRENVLVLDNILHRLRVPRRVAQAADLACDGTKIEALERLGDASAWMSSYLARIKSE